MCNGQFAGSAGGTLAKCILDALASSAKGMKAGDVTDAVIAAGYRSSSPEFGRIVAATLRKTPGIRRVSRGVSKLTKRGKK